MGMTQITRRQGEVLEWVSWFISSKGYPPTLREIAAWMGARSTNAAADHVKALERKGAIERDRGVARGIRLVRK